TRRAGKQSAASTNRETAASHRPPMYPASAPRGRPTSAETAAVASPTTSETRAPWASRAATSRPSPSVPIQCAVDGGARTAARSVRFGHGASHGAANAASATAATRTNGTGSRRRAGGTADPRIGPRGEQVGDRDRGQGHGARHQRQREEDRKVARQDRLEQKRSEPGKIEHLLDEERPSQHARNEERRQGQE